MSMCSRTMTQTVVGHTLPVFELARGPAFDSRAIELLGEALDLALQKLTLLPPLIVQELMANQIIELARTGERDVNRLQDAAIGVLVQRGRQPEC